jgi:heat shock protein HslJ
LEASIALPGSARDPRRIAGDRCQHRQRWLPQRGVAQQAAAALAGTTWRLTSLTMDGKTAAPDDRMKYTLSFDKKGYVAIHADCNRGRGRYMDPSGALEINKVTLTRAHCAPGSIADQFARALGFTQAYTIQNGNLLLALPGNGDTLHFERSATTGK